MLCLSSTLWRAVQAAGNLMKLLPFHCLMLNTPLQVNT